MKAIASWFACAALVGVCLIADQRPAPAQIAQGCWLVYWISTGEKPGDNPDEVICLTSPTAGQVRESAIFGTGVKGCNRVTVDRKGAAVTLTVDYSKCTNNSPSHTLSCPSPKGTRIRCEWAMLNPKDGGGGPAYLVREKR